MDEPSESLEAAAVKGRVDGWRVVAIAEEALVGSTLDALARRAQSKAVLELLAFANSRAHPFRRPAK